MRNSEKDDEALAKIRVEIKERLIEWKMAVYPSINRAARALSAYVTYHQGKKRA
jgi:hypothetical protein